MILYTEDLYELIEDSMRQNCPLLWELLRTATPLEKKRLFDKAFKHTTNNIRYFMRKKAEVIHIGHVTLQHKRAKRKEYYSYKKKCGGNDLTTL